MTHPALIWFRQDLRVDDNPALTAACAGGRPVVALYVLETQGPRPLGGAAQWWLHGALTALAEALEDLGIPLILRRGDARAQVVAVAAALKAVEVHWTRRYDPGGIDTDKQIKAALKQGGTLVESHPGALLFEPWDIQTGSGGPYKVFTPFWKALQAKAQEIPPPDDRPARRQAPAKCQQIETDTLDDWGLLPTHPDWAGGLRETWTPGAPAARTRLETFLQDAAGHYNSRRDTPGVDGTSRLSPHLHWGEIGPRTVWHRTHAAWAHQDTERWGEARVFLSELAWRDFCHVQLFYNPHMPEAPLDQKFAAFPWVEDERLLFAWQQGQTGYPIVDAGMRQLWHTGWMHNRVRMIVASFLVKHLLIPWQQGEAWFWDCLVDADAASNSAGWQWAAGCGADAAPYFRIFNPTLQGQKFDPDGTYVRHWVPELDSTGRYLHEPWKRSDPELSSIRKRGYPRPIVDHKRARQRALDAYQQVKAA